ncbi:FAD-linked oxidase [Asanoa ishikariensis]|uniref:FAD/FMN-containing dehydrogenase n=1 Tax=Asanoa ishikariensis TaxID=137265 RepID=A0A1H3T2E7_9ACTN|nr:FAD-binding oxidoreductase [Asanoa ishikariensis]GIF63196.1 FAD-linked oxidase [Asanoa ishikariensis]SDZ43519.1 FAD/FMN-containing dehydrogenase [Asanoa ishikariensis]
MTTSSTHLTTLTPDETAAAAAATILAGRLSEGAAVHLPGEDGHSAALVGYNLTVRHRPLVVVATATPEDVAETVRFATEHRLRVAVRSTGHGPGTATEGGLLINTERMTEVTVDPASWTARVGAGARWQQVIDAAARHGLAAANGSSPTVGVVGYTLGGGLSPILGRTRGYAADNVISIDLVTADGVARTVTAASDPELFWGLRGGKSGFGVITAIEFRLFPLSHLYGGAIFFDGEHAGAVLHAWRDWVEGTPDELSSSIAVLRMPPIAAVPEPLRGRLVVHVRVAYLGSADDGARHVAPIRAAAPAIIDAVGEMPYTAVAAIHSDPVDPMPVYERSALLRDLPAEAVDRLVDVAVENADVPVTLVELRHLAGALRRPPREPNAVANRDAPFLLFLASVAAADEAAAHTAFHERVLSELGAWTTGRTFANFLTPGDGRAEHLATAYPADVHARLVALKRHWDPDGRFADRS